MEEGRKVRFDADEPASLVHIATDASMASEGERGQARGGNKRSGNEITRCFTVRRDGRSEVSLLCRRSRQGCSLHEVR